MTQNREIEIDLIDLFLSVCKQWRKLLVLFLVGAIMGCGVSYYKMNTMRPENIENYLSGLEDEEINEDNIRHYADSQALYDSALERSDSSVILNMDQNNVYRAQLKYYLSCGYEHIDEVTANLNALLGKDENLAKILSASTLNCTETDIHDLLSAYAWKIGLDSQIIGDNNIITSRSANYEISISAPNEASLSGMSNAVKECVENYANELAKAYPEMEFSMLGENTFFGYDSSVASYQKDFINSRQALLKDATTANDKLSDDEKLYYSYYYDRDNLLENYEFGFSKKWPVVGAVALALVGAMWFAVKYVFDQHIKTENEFSTYGLQILGSLDSPKAKQFFLDKWFNKLSNASLVPANSEEYISAVIQNIDAETIALFSAGSSASADALAASLAKTCDKLTYAGDLLSKESAIEKLKNSDKILFIIQLGETTRSELERCISLTEKYSKAPYGTIVIR